MVGTSIGGIYAITTLFFRQHRIQLYRVGNRCRSIHLAGTPSPATGRSVAASAHPAQLPLHRVSISGARGRVARPALCLRAVGGLWGHYCAILALLALISLPTASGIVIAWIFSLWGTADLFNAFYQANHAGLTAGQLGPTYFIPTFIVPLLLMTHGLGFRILLRHENESVMREGRQAA